MSAPNDLIGDPSQEAHRLDIVRTLCEILENRRPREVAHAKPAMKHFEKILETDGSASGLESFKEIAISAFLRQEDGSEESKTDEAEIAKVKARVDKIFTQLADKKKAAPSANRFKKFVQTQKQDLNQMVLSKNKSDEPMLITEKPQSAAGVVPTEMSQTVKLPKTGDPLAHHKCSGDLASPSGDNRPLGAEELGDMTPKGQNEKVSDDEEDFERSGKTTTGTSKS